MLCPEPIAAKGKRESELGADLAQDIHLKKDRTLGCVRVQYQASPSPHNSQTVAAPHGARFDEKLGRTFVVPEGDRGSAPGHGGPSTCRHGPRKFPQRAQ